MRDVPLTDEVAEGIRGLRASFSALYGREAHDDELVFATQTNPTDTVSSFARELLRCGVDPAYVYAYCRSDGLMPAEMNLDLISDADLEDFETYVEEYRKEFATATINDGKASSLIYVSLGNEFLTEALSMAVEGLDKVLNDFLSRHARGRRFTEFQIRNPVDYCLFSAFKTLKTLRSIDNEDAPEIIYALSRSLVENYLYLKTIAEDPGFFEDKILPRVDDENFRFVTKNGRINYNQVIHQDSGEIRSVWTTPAKLIAQAHMTRSDRDIYELFYVTACQFVHVDVLAARAYFHDSDPFDEIDPALIARLIAFVLAAQLVSALAAASGVHEQYRTDIAFFLSTLAEPLESCLQLVDSDSEHPNAIYATLIEVTRSWS